MHRVARVRALALVALALLGGGCADDMTSASLLVRSRALAGRVEVVGAEPRATPRPGEDVHVEIHVGDPAAELPRTYAMVVCEASAGSIGTPLCARFDAPIASVTMNTLPTGPEPQPNPAIDFTVPSTLSPEVGELLVLGVFCAGGQTDLPGVFRYFGELADGSASGPPPVCTDPAFDGEIFTLRVPVEHAPEDTNDNPAIARIELAGVPLDYVAPPDAPAEGCLSLEGVARIGRTARIGVVAAPDARQTRTLVDEETGDTVEELETLQITYIGTAGEFERTYGFLEPDEGSNRDSLEWEAPAPEEIPEDGLLVRFYFVLRDGWGGVDLVERALCFTRG